MNILDDLKTVFEQVFAASDNLRSFFAPGRVNLIGEHLDYNGGYVLPCALDIGTYAVARPRDDALFCIYSVNYPGNGVVRFSLDELYDEQHPAWTKYVKGVIKAFMDSSFEIIHGLDICFQGNMPNSAGLSSSASIEVLTLVILKKYFNLAHLTMEQVARLGQIAENDFVGVSCGIMDQFASAMAKKDQAILLNCANLEYKYAPLNLKGYKLVIGNTKKERRLADSVYNLRVQECTEALRDLRAKLTVSDLCSMSLTVFLKNSKLIKEQIHYNRAYHVVTENERTVQAFNALERSDLISFGQLLNQSHDSLRDYYEVTGFELDCMVNAAQKHPGCIGARMTGAGLGGCTVNIVKVSQVEDFIDQVKTVYTKKTSLLPEFYIVNSGDGAREL